MNKIQGILQEEISRKEFLRYIGLAILAMIGVTSFINNLTTSFSQKTTKTQKQTGGYGMSPYGH